MEKEKKASVWLVNCICMYYNIIAGNIEFGCYGLSALQKAFDRHNPIQIDVPSYGSSHKM
jgi:hypothetical protein